MRGGRLLSSGDDAPVRFAEYGERVDFPELLLFLKLTGELGPLARRALARQALGGEALEGRFDGGPDPDAHARSVIDALRLQNGWPTSKEMLEAAGELGAGLEWMEEAIRQETQATLTAMRLARTAPAAFSSALRAELLLDDLALKRAAIRCGSIREFAQQARAAGLRPTGRELDAARDCLCGKLDLAHWRQAMVRLADWGVNAAGAEGFVQDVALARLRVAQLRFPPGRWNPGSLRSRGFRSRIKRAGDGRFTLGPSKALALARRLLPVVGVTRVEVVGRHGPAGFQIAVARRPGSAGSSAIASGKARTASGAMVGAIMEEVEQWAQGRFPGPEGRGPDREGTYGEISRRGPAIDPQLLDLPFDTRYRPDQTLRWWPCEDLLGGGRTWVPLDALDARRSRNDIYDSKRAGRKVFSSNGLASAFTAEEALLQAVCELIERHAQLLSNVTHANPGKPGGSSYRVIDARSLPRGVRRLLASLEEEGPARLIDITSDVEVPTFWAFLQTGRAPGAGCYGAGRETHHGFAAHPSPETAATLALLEAAQSRADLAPAVRERGRQPPPGLARSERTGAMTRQARQELFALDPPVIPFSEVTGLESRDVLEDVAWVLQQLRRSGANHLLVADYSVKAISPARVLRAIIPGLETNNPFRTGFRARARLLADLLGSAAR
jgi:ribosomal protein S12 methylthiotransferase accessory factor